MKQITNVNDLQEGDVMELSRYRYKLGVISRVGRRVYIFEGSSSDLAFYASEVQDLMDHGIPFRRKVAEGGEK